MEGQLLQESAHRDSIFTFTNHTGDIFQDEAETYINYIIGENVCSGNGDTSGKSNILFGHEVAKNSDDIGNFNTLMGHNTGEFLSGGDYNTGYGMSSLNKLTNGNNNIGVGYYSGYNITTGNYNICIGNGAGPTTSNSTETHRLYIDVGETSSTGSDENSLIYGDQSGSNQDLTLNADVYISKSTTNSNGTLEVEGGEVKIWAGNMTTEANHYKINFPKGDATYPYRNIQITNKNRGIGSLTADNNQYENVLIGFQMPTNPGNRNTLIGGFCRVGHDWLRKYWRRCVRFIQ